MDGMQQGNGKSQQGSVNQGNMDSMHNTFWLEDRISVTFAVNVLPGQDFPSDAVITKELHLQVEGLNENIKDIGFTLNFFTEQDRQSRLRPDSQQSYSFGDKHTLDDSNTFPPGVYLFGPPFRVHRGESISVKGVSFLRLEKIEGAQPVNNDEDCKDDPTLGPIPRISNRLNCRLKKQNTSNVQQVSISSAAPTYMCGATNGPPQAPITQGCPLSPAIPIPVDEACSSFPGLWPFTLPELPADLQIVTGYGVTVFVLDTLPQLEQIKHAAEVAGDNNLLLQDVVNNVEFTYPVMEDGVDAPGPLQPRTGKDIHGRSVGFNMPDHGLFIAGIIHDLAPKAKIECIRVLNDFCTGTTQTLIAALSTILNRLSSGGNLEDQPVVINMSLVIPDDGEVTRKGIDPTTLAMTRESLQAAIQILVDLGVIFVASAGNEGDQRFNPMSSVRPKALYPAAYTYDGLVRPEYMIPVGAVNKNGSATVYSCYPGDHGFATYGGDLPQPSDIEDGQGYDMTAVKNIDAPIGLYTSPLYPALSMDDPQSTYPAPNTHGWAYWIGTSFATPIVSAIAARALELEKGHSVGSTLNPPPIVSPAATRKVNWTNLATAAASSSTNPNPETNAPGPMIWAVQCQPDVTEDEDVEVEINITEVNITINEE